MRIAFAALPLTQALNTHDRRAMFGHSRVASPGTVTTIYPPSTGLHALHSLPRARAQSGMLGASETTLQELHNVRVLHGSPPRDPLLPLSRFSGLRVLTLCCVYDDDGDFMRMRCITALGIVLSHLPVSLQVMLAQRVMSAISC